MRTLAQIALTPYKSTRDGFAFGITVAVSTRLRTVSCGAVSSHSGPANARSTRLDRAR